MIPSRSPNNVTMLRFELIVENPAPVKGHQRYRTEGYINEGLEQHLAECSECRATIAKDLREWARQIEFMKGR